MNTTSRIKMDLTRPDPTLVLNAVQGDANTRSLQIALYHGIVPWTIPTGITAAIRYAKPDKTKGYYDTLCDGTPAWSVKDHILTVQLAPQMLTVPGTVTMQVELHHGTSTLSTFSLKVDVEANPAAGFLKSEDYVNWLQWIYDQAQSHTHRVLQAAQDAAASANTAAELVHRAETAASKSTEAALAAESAKTDAAESAAQVHAIVAGNEAYTKQESDLRYGAAIVQTVCGTQTRLEASAQMPLLGLNLYGKTTQQGTPSPDAPAALTHTAQDGAVDVIVLGKNLVDISIAPTDTTKNGIRFRINDDGSFDVSGTATGNVSFSFGWDGDGSRLPELLKVGGYFVLFCDKAAYNGKTFNCSIAYRYNGATKYISADGKPTQVPVGAEYINTTIYVPAGSTVVQVEGGHLQLESGHVATAYAPYAEQIIILPTPGGLPGIPVSSGGNWTDETGQQWLCDEIDLQRGVHIRRIGTLAFRDITVTDWSGGGYCFEVPSGIRDVGSTYRAVPSTHFATADVQPESLALNQIVLAGGTVYFRVDTAAYTSTAAFEAFLHQLDGAMLYELAQHIETPLSAQITEQYASLRAYHSSTHLLNDAKAGMAARYLTDLQSYIDQKIARVNA